MKIISLFILLIYWSIIILAPVLAKEGKIYRKQVVIFPEIKPNT